MTLDWAVLWDERWPLLRGAATTVGLALVTMAIALPLGLLVALLRRSSLPIVRIGTAAYVELFRSTPLILQIYWAFYVMPVAIGLRLDAVATAITGLVLNVTAYNSETFRAGLASIRPGQRNAGLALGMSAFQVFRVVTFPQALRRVTPALASTWVSLFKDTSLVSVIAVGDLAYTAMQLRAQTFRVFEILTGMAVLYWVMGYPQAKLVDWLYRKFRVAE